MSRLTPVPSCNHVRTFTITASDACGNPATPCVVTYSWTDDTAPPTFTCPSGGDLGCNPPSFPDCASVKGLVHDLVDNCDAHPVLDCNPGTLQVNGCARSQTFTLTARDACGNTSPPCGVTYTWTVSTLSVVVELCPTIAAPELHRCITFELRDCPSGAPLTFDRTLDFILNSGTGVATAVDVFPISCGTYTCVTARDRFHTLQRMLPLQSASCEYAAAFTAIRMHA